MTEIYVQFYEVVAKHDNGAELSRIILANDAQTACLIMGWHMASDGYSIGGWYIEYHEASEPRLPDKKG